MHECIDSPHELDLDDDVQEIVRIRQEFPNCKDRVSEHVRKLFEPSQICSLRLNEERDEEQFPLLIEDLINKRRLQEKTMEKEYCYHSRYSSVSMDLWYICVEKDSMPVEDHEFEAHDSFRTHIVRM